MFGMVFGQTELTTRVYNLNLQNINEDFSLTLEEITNISNLPFAYINIGDYISYDIESEANYMYLGIQSGSKRNYIAGFIVSTDNEILTLSENTGAIVSNDDLITLVSGSSIGFNELYVTFIVTAEFPEEDTGYIEEGFDYCIDVGANLVASPCRDEVDIIDSLPSEIADNLNGIIGQGVAATNQDGVWVGSLTGLGGGNGYWLQSNVNACFNYNCAEN